MAPKRLTPKDIADEMRYLAAAKKAISPREWAAAIKSCLDKVVEDGDAHGLLAIAKVLPGALAPTKNETTLSFRPEMPAAKAGIADRLVALCDQIFAEDGTIDVTSSARVLPAPTTPTLNALACDMSASGAPQATQTPAASENAPIASQTVEPELPPLRVIPAIKRSLNPES